MTTPNPMNPGKRSFRSLLFNRSTILSFVAGAAVAVAVGVSAQVAAMGAWHHGSILRGLRGPLTGRRGARATLRARGFYS